MAAAAVTLAASPASGGAGAAAPAMSANITTALGRWEQELICPLCHRLFVDPYTIAECEHSFCHECIYDTLGEKCACPVCQRPAWVKTLRRNLTLATVVDLHRQFCHLSGYTCPAVVAAPPAPSQATPKRAAANTVDDDAPGTPAKRAKNDDASPHLDAPNSVENGRARRAASRSGTHTDPPISKRGGPRSIPASAGRTRRRGDTLVGADSEEEPPEPPRVLRARSAPGAIAVGRPAATGAGKARAGRSAAVAADTPLAPEPAVPASAASPLPTDDPFSFGASSPASSLASQSGRPMRPASVVAATKLITPTRWACPACTLENGPTKTHCDACNTRRPAPMPPPAIAAVALAAPPLLSLSRVPSASRGRQRRSAGGPAGGSGASSGKAAASFTHEPIDSIFKRVAEAASECLANDLAAVNDLATANDLAATNDSSAAPAPDAPSSPDIIPPTQPECTAVASPPSSPTPSPPRSRCQPSSDDLRTASLSRRSGGAVSAKSHVISSGSGGRRPPLQPSDGSSPASTKRRTATPLAASPTAATDFAESSARRRKAPASADKENHQPTAGGDSTNEGVNVPTTPLKARKRASKAATAADVAPRSPVSEGPIVLATTGLDDDERAKLHDCITKLGGQRPVRLVAEVDDPSVVVTHVVTTTDDDGLCRRTLKYMLGILRGAWIVNFSWITASAEAGRFLPETNYEIQGDSVFGIGRGPRRGRKAAPTKLFAGFKVYLHGDFILPTPPKEDLERLLTAGGAKILTRRPPPTTLLPGARAAKEMVDTSHPIVIYDPTCVLEDPANAYIKGKRQAYEATWLLNCISCFSTTDHCVDS